MSPPVVMLVRNNMFTRTIAVNQGLGFGGCDCCDTVTTLKVVHLKYWIDMGWLRLVGSLKL